MVIKPIVVVFHRARLGAQDAPTHGRPVGATPEDVRRVELERPRIDQGSEAKHNGGDYV